MGIRRGGRQKGTPNKRTQQATELLQSLNFDPLVAMVEIARNPAHPPELRGRMCAELARYAYPQLRATEHTADVDVTAGGGIDLAALTTEELEAMELVGEAMDRLAAEKARGVH